MHLSWLEQPIADRRTLVDRLCGGLDDVFCDGYLEELRLDWPR